MTQRQAVDRIKTFPLPCDESKLFNINYILGMIDTAIYILSKFMLLGCISLIDRREFLTRRSTLSAIKSVFPL